MFTTDVLKAHPVVYGADEDRYRPRLPPQHANPVEERANVMEAIELIACASRGLCCHPLTDYFRLARSTVHSILGGAGKGL